MSTTAVSTIREMLDKSKDQIALALPKHLDADRMLRIAMTSIQQNPKLMECTPKSLIAAVIEAAQLGLEPDGILGRAYLVPYKVKGELRAQLQIGYRGFIDLAYRSGRVNSIYAHPVFEKDHYEIQLGLEPRLVHIPAEGDRGKLVAAYAVVKLKEGDPDFEWMWMSDIEKIRRSSKAADDGPWQTHPEEMARKTPIRRLAKRIPLSTDFVRAGVLDEYVDAGVYDSSRYIDITGKSQERIVDLKHRLAEAKKEQQAEEEGQKEPPKEEEKPKQDKKQGKKDTAETEKPVMVECPYAMKDSEKMVPLDECTNACEAKETCKAYRDAMRELSQP